MTKAEVTAVTETMQIGGWFFKAKPNRQRDGFIAWCAKTPELGSGPLDLPLSVAVYFEFGDTAEEAIAKLKREVLH